MSLRGKLGLMDLNVTARDSMPSERDPNIQLTSLRFHHESRSPIQDFIRGVCSTPPRLNLGQRKARRSFTLLVANLLFLAQPAAPLSPYQIASFLPLDYSCINIKALREAPEKANVFIYIRLFAKEFASQSFSLWNGRTVLFDIKSNIKQQAIPDVPQPSDSRVVLPIRAPLRKIGMLSYDMQAWIFPYHDQPPASNSGML